MNEITLVFFAVIVTVIIMARRNSKANGEVTIPDGYMLVSIEELNNEVAQMEQRGLRIAFQAFAAGHTASAKGLVYSTSEKTGRIMMSEMYKGRKVLMYTYSPLWQEKPRSVATKVGKLGEPTPAPAYPEYDQAPPPEEDYEYVTA